MEGKSMSPEDQQLEWIQVQKDFSSLHAETTKEKLIRKIKENPVVPVGCMATTAALCYGLWSFRTGNRRMSQIMMRTRIAAQGLTVVALVAGVVWTYDVK